MSNTIKVFSVFLLILLTACGNVNLAPEAAAKKMLLEETTEGMLVDETSVDVRQTIKMEDGRAIVAITFQGARAEMGLVDCFYTYQVRQQVTGWVAANGGGTCQDSQPERRPADLHVMVGHYSGERPGEPGYTQVYGRVNNPSIVKVQVTWGDNVRTEAEVVNATILTVRTDTQLMPTAVEGLDAQGQVVYSVSI